MTTYTVFIEETLCKGTDIEANTIEEALDIARGMYKRSEIILTADDVGTDAQIMAEKQGAETAMDEESTEWTDL
jgi:hypothetical protein